MSEKKKKKKEVRSDNSSTKQKTRQINKMSCTRTKQTLCVNDHDSMDGVQSCPNPHGAGLLCGGRLKHFPSEKEGVVQGVRFALPGVAEDGDHLEELIWAAA